MNRKEDYGGSDKNMDGFLSLIWHGAHDDGEGKDREWHVIVEIARDVRGGQYNIYFCSTKCLRSYLNFCVDELENKLKILNNKSKLAKKKRSNKKARHL